jgi:hypothetical protein
MNTEPATEITTQWLPRDEGRAQTFASRLVGLLPEPDYWALYDEPPALLALIKRSLFYVPYAPDTQPLTVCRAIVTDDADTQIVVQDGIMGLNGQWTRAWTLRFLRVPTEFPPELRFETTPHRDLPPERLEALARRVSRLAGWKIKGQKAT